MKRYFLSALIALPLLILAFAFAGTIKLTGKVTDEKGRPIRGASVWVKGVSKVTTTDTAGKFSIEVPGQKSVLIVSSVGYEKKEVSVGGSKSFVIKLKIGKQSLDEVAVVGYGKQLSGMAPRELEKRSAGVVGFASPQILKDEESYDKVYMRTDRDKSEAWRYNNNFNREGYDNIAENRFLKA